MENMMMTFSQYKNRNLWQRFLFAAMIAVVLPAMLPLPPAEAAPKFRPARRRAPLRTEATGVRSGGVIGRVGDLKGCAKDLAVPLSLLVPEQMGQTVSGRPALFWYLAAKKDVTVQFYELPEKGSKKVLWRKQVKVEQPGIAQLTFPSNQPELEVGKVYAWSVELLCDGVEVDQAGTIVQAQLERVEPSQWLTENLRQAKTEQRRADLYALSGQWYNSLDAIAIALAADPEDKTIQQDLISLIEQVGLKNIADRER
jgi:hypothetical protein